MRPPGAHCLLIRTGLQCKTVYLLWSNDADWSLVDPLEYLGPFLEVIRSPETSGPITGVALSSVCRMLDEYTLGAPSAKAVFSAVRQSLQREPRTQLK